ncbi:flavin monoamine oxidase family protein [Mycolicibacterium sediminis]|uniref:Oxidoreductase n=1 Tax=Mycolicibacterium sediminis TaxID=1286180 RepID=A0A7I7QRE5_9MYCO|nr:FAD-dependent oxidoreductase [Mycolicibacterium sediminis]BBY28931.1 oxidoreductase [Mycolicibacterium sediminis]
MSVDDVDVLVIGAGLAGLRCAAVLAAAGSDVRVWEAADDVGGRVRTDLVDGFRCDHGFQVLNPAYPELPRAVDVDALRLQGFGPGVAVRRDRGSTVWVHPLRSPARVPAMLARGGLGPRNLVSVARWATPALRPRALKAASNDTSMRDALDAAGVRGELRRVIDRFLAGVLLEDSGETSNAFVLLLLRMFVFGVPALPAGGMHALPRLLAEPIEARIDMQHNVVGMSRDGGEWRVESPGGSIRARHVVIAADPVTAAGLAGLPEPRMRSVVTDWWAADEAPTDPPMLWVDGRTHPTGPVLNTSVISAAAPTYAPAGRHLIAASALVGADGVEPDEAVVRRHAGDILGTDAKRWERLTRHVIPGALPAQPPPLAARRPVRLPDGRWVCGDHRDTASIQGALVSGRRTAEALLRAGK